MTTTRHETVVCSCGRGLNACAPADHSDAVPGEGDLTMCLYCGTMYTMHAGRWQRASVVDLEDMGEALAVMELARRKSRGSKADG